MRTVSWDGDRLRDLKPAAPALVIVAPERPGSAVDLETRERIVVIVMVWPMDMAMALVVSLACNGFRFLYHVELLLPSQLKHENRDAYMIDGQW